MITFQCRDCGCNNAYHSRKRSTFERFLLPLFLLRPVRCEHCFRRQYVTVLCEVQERPQHPDRSQSRWRVAA
jgi:hypothetical protein